MVEAGATGDTTGRADPLRIQLFGGLRAHRRGVPVDLGSPKQRAVLALLTLELGRVVPVERVVDLLWDGGADGSVASLQVYVSRLRAVLEPDRRPREPSTVLVTQAPGYRLAIERSSVDLYRFEDAVAAGLDDVRREAFDRARVALDDALALVTGPVLPELVDLPVIVDAMRRVESLRLSALEASARLRLRTGDHDAVVRLLDDEARANPGRERVVGTLALALYRSQRQSDALAIIERCRRALRESSGLSLGAELARLEVDILEQSPELDGPATTAAVGATGVAEDAGGRAVVTRSKRAVAAGLIGRDAELAAAGDALAALSAGRGGAIVISGEPGIGKSALAEAIVAAAHERGIVSAWARCPEHRSAPPLWAVAQLCEQLAADGVAVPVEVPPGGGADDSRDRFAVFRTVIGGLAASPRPSVLVVDDLQWADPDSLRLIEHLAVEVAAMRALLVVTTRPLDDGAAPAAVDALAEISRVPGCLQLRPAALRVDEVEHWLAGHHQVDAAAVGGLAGLIHDRTGGNPLFVREVIALLATDGALDDERRAYAARAIPPAVQFVVRRRVSGLPRPTQQLLSVAAVLGPRVDVAVLADAAEREPSTILPELEPAFAAGLLSDADGEIGFSHVLVAEALADEVNSSRRAMIHAAAARSLARTAGADFGTQAAAVAHHAIEGILAGTGELAVQASIRAATVASSRSAHEDAAAHWADAARALERWRPSDVEPRIRALIEQARAFDRVDMVRAAKVPILAAIEAAEAARRDDLMIEAASLLNHSHVWSVEPYGEVDERVVGALERSLTVLDEDDVRRRAVLLGALPAELVFAERHRHTQACDRAIDAARRVGEPLTVARALNNTMLPKRPDNLDVRRARAEEMLALDGLPVDLRYAGHHHLAEAWLEAGDLRAAAEQLELGRQALTSTPGSRLHNQYLWFAATLAVAAGRYEEAAALADRAYELHRTRRRYDADVLMLSARAALAIDRGGFDTLLAGALAAVDVGGYGRATAEAFAFGALELGDVDGARHLVAPFDAGTGFGDDFMTLFSATAALHVRVELGDLPAATAAASVLAGYEDRWAGAGAAPLSLGFVSLALARFHTAIGDHGRARQAFDQAVRAADRAGALAWRARGLVHQAAFLLDAGDPVGAERSLAEAAEIARRLRLPYVERRLQLLGG